MPLLTHSSHRRNSPAATFSSLDNSRCVVALLSPSYCDSAMCREEFSVSQFLSKAQSWSGTLLPVLVSSMGNATVPDFIAITESDWLVNQSDKHLGFVAHFWL